MAKYRLVAFDSDGTLVDSLPWFARAFNELAARQGLEPLDPTGRERLRQLTTREMLRELKIPLWKIAALLAGMRKLMAAHLDEFSLFDGIAESLQRLSSSGAILGIVSSNARDNIRHILGPANAGLIRHYACGASMFGKPAKLRALLKAAGVSAREAIYIGDEIRDAEAAHQTGMAYGAVGWGCHALETLRAQPAEEYFEHPLEIGDKLS